MPSRSASTVLITGATSGLGRYVARALARQGWTVLAHGRDPGKLAGLLDELGGNARGYAADLASLAQVRRLAEQVREEVPRLGALVNNAAVGFGPPGAGRERSHDGHELRLAVNYLAPVLLTRLLLPLLVASAPSRIVNVGSIGQVPLDLDDVEFTRGYNGVDAYRRSKLALAAFTFDLAEELRGTGVTVNCIHPASLMPTAMVQESGFAPLSTVEQGGTAVLRLVTDPALAQVTGEFFNGLAAARALPQAYDRRFRRRLRQVTGRLLGTGGERPGGAAPAGGPGSR